MARLYVAKLKTSHLEGYVADLVGNDDKGNFPLALKAKCRELARADSAILVAPTPESLSSPYGAPTQLSLWLVTKCGHISNSKLREKLQQLNLNLSHKVTVSHSVLQACYQFSLIARLAPKWNRVSNWLVKGTDFLTTGKAQALSLEVGVTDGELTLTVNVCKFSINLLKARKTNAAIQEGSMAVEDLGVTTATLNQFRTEPHYAINEISINSNRCLLLPNFSTGYIFSASHQVPSSHEFVTYDSLRVHWKKQHGFILPERQDLFYQVFFRSNPTKFFTYPGCCVSRGYPLVYPSRDSQAVASAFRADIQARLPTICGEPVNFFGTALTPFADLQTASNSSPHPNARPSASIRSSFGLQGIRRVPAPPRLPTASVPLRPSVFTFQAARSNTCQSNAQCVPSLNVITTTPIPTKDGLLPHSSVQSTNVTAVMSERGGLQQPRGPIVPVFKPRFSSLSSSGSQQPRGGAQEARRVPLVPSFKPQLPAAVCGRSANNAGNKPAYRKVAGPRSTSHANTSSVVAPPPAKRQCLPSRFQHLTSESVTPSLPTAGLTSSAGVTPTPPSVMSSLRSSTLDQSCQQTVPDVSDPWPHQDSLMEAEISPVCSKKAKASRRTEVVQVEGVPEEVIKQISKTKVPLLKRWLQANGVKCSGKDKKDSLVRYAALHIKQTGKTFEAPAGPDR